LNTARPQMAPEQPKPALAPKADVAPPAAPVKRPAPVSAEVPAPALASKTEAFVAVAWHDNGRPHWAQDRFDVLLFKVYGLTLAVPLIALGQIQPITEDLTPIFGQAKWFMGLQPTPMGQIKTVNTALFVMPERYNPEFLKTAKYVVSIDGLDWGLAVDSVQQPKSLDPEDVKWRTGRGQRPWLAGTIKAHMCALIDVQNMGRMLAASDRNRNH
jgi:purine-binding chemotaxis protein CheW